MGRKLGEVIDSLPKRRRKWIDARYREFKEEVDGAGRRFSSQDIHNALFPKKGKRKPAADVKEGIRKYIRRRHAGG
jgi:hypothetical protein